MKKKFPDISLIKFTNSMRNTFSLRCVIFTKATITSQSMNTAWPHGTRRTYPKLAKTFPFWVTVTNSPEFSLIFGVFPKFHEFSPDWKIGNSFSRFSLISRVAGNPVCCSHQFSQRLRVLALGHCRHVCEFGDEIYQQKIVNCHFSRDRPQSQRMMTYGPQVNSLNL